LHDQGSEAEPCEQIEAALLRGATVAERVRIEIDRAIGVNLRERAALAGVLGVVEQPLALALVRHVGRMGEQVFERAVLRDQLARPLFTDARYSLDVVDRIARP